MISQKRKRAKNSLITNFCTNIWKQPFLLPVVGMSVSKAFKNLNSVKDSKADICLWIFRHNIDHTSAAAPVEN